MSEVHENIMPAYLKDSSLNLLPQLHRTMQPSWSFCMSITGLRILGTAAEASKAVQIILSSAVM